MVRVAKRVAWSLLTCPDFPEATSLPVIRRPALLLLVLATIAWRPARTEAPAFPGQGEPARAQTRSRLAPAHPYPRDRHLPARNELKQNTADAANDRTLRRLRARQTVP